jgi:hypothetical protein
MTTEKNMARRSIRVPLMLLLAAGAASLTTRALMRSDKAAPAASTTDTDIADLREEIRQLREESRKTVSLVGATAGRARAATPPEAAAAPAQEEPQLDADGVPTTEGPGAKRPAKPITWDGFWSTVRQKFSAQSRDVAWGHDAAVVASRDLMRELPKGSTVGAIECRSTVCRAELTHPSLDAFHQHTTQMTVSQGREWKGQRMSTVTKVRDDGSVEVETYFVRQADDPNKDAIAELIAP